jgi:hypothetical protein
MNPIELMKNAEKLSVQQLQQAVESGTLPAYIGVPLIQEKVKQQQQMQTAVAGQQGPQATVKDQIMQQAGVTQLPSGLPEEYADGGIVSFAFGGDSRKASKAQEIEAVLGRAAAEAYLQGFAWPEQQMQEKLNSRNTNVPTLSEAMKNSPPAKFAGDVVDFTKQAAGTYGDLYEEGGIPAIAEYQKANIQGVASGIGDKLKSAVSKITPDVEKLYYGPKGKREDFAGLSGTAKMDVAQTIDEAAAVYGVDPKALRALAQIESGMNPNAKNPDPNSTASGLFQFTKGTAKDYGINNAFDPRESAFAAARMLRENVDKYGDYTLAASAHNLGRFSKPETLAKNTDYINTFNKAYIAQGGEQPKGIESLTPQQQAAPQAQGSDMSGIEQALAANMYSADETDPAKIAAQYKAMIGDDKGIAALRDKIASMEAKQASAEEKAPWLALMQAGLATMAGTSPYAAVNIGQGMQTGLEAYTKSQADAEKGELQRYKLEAELANAQRELDISVATKGIESADARRKFNKVTALQNEQFKYNQQQEDRRIGLQERTTAVAERRQNKYDMIEEQAQRLMAENPNMSSTEAYAKAAQMFPTGGTSSISAEMRAETARTNKRNSLVRELAGLGLSKEDQLRKEQIRQQLAALDAESRLGRQAPAPSGTTSGWSNFQQVSR